MRLFFLPENQDTDTVIELWERLYCQESFFFFFWSNKCSEPENLPLCSESSECSPNYLCQLILTGDVLSCNITDSIERQLLPSLLLLLGERSKIISTITSLVQNMIKTKIVLAMTPIFKQWSGRCSGGSVGWLVNGLVLWSPVHPVYTSYCA